MRLAFCGGGGLLVGGGGGTAAAACGIGLRAALFCWPLLPPPTHAPSNTWRLLKPRLNRPHTPHRDSYVVRGVTHNLPFLRAAVGSPAFAAGDYDTTFIPRYFPTDASRAPAAFPLAPAEEEARARCAVSSPQALHAHPPFLHLLAPPL